jgi:hypothetical protein
MLQENTLMSTHTSALDGVNDQRHALAALYARGKDPRYPLYKRLGGAPEPVWTQRLEEESFSLCRGSNLDLSAVQPAARHYTD